MTTSGASAASLLDEARAIGTSKGPDCSVGKLLLDPVIGPELAQALAATVQSTALGKALKARGYAVLSDTIARHRRGDCKCRS